MSRQLALFESAAEEHPRGRCEPDELLAELRAFRWEGKRTFETVLEVPADDRKVHIPVFINEFWTSRQRAAHSLHEVSYRACFKPQLPRFFISRLTSSRDRVYDPFSGRGTTPLEAALNGRVPVACDANPLSRILLEPRLAPPHLDEIAKRLHALEWNFSGEVPEGLLVFYHPDTLRELCALRDYLATREHTGTLDDIDRWIRMVAVNRLTGHSPGFFSVYTLPPNQAVSIEAQKKINEQRNQTPPRRHVGKLIVAKSRSLLSDVDEHTRSTLKRVRRDAQLITSESASTRQIAEDSVALVVTSPPFLDVVDYAGDNWLRCWFCDIDPAAVPITITRQLADWKNAVHRVFVELIRVISPAGYVAFEVGEVRGGKVRLEETVIPAAVEAGFQPCALIINSQEFTKTAACWGVSNNSKGTNTNRIVVLRRPEIPLT